MAEMATTFFVDSEVDEIEVSLLRLTRRTLSLKVITDSSSIIKKKKFDTFPDSLRHFILHLQETSDTWFLFCFWSQKLVYLIKYRLGLENKQDHVQHQQWIPNDD